MFDIIGILISSCLIVYTIFRAIKLDKDLEWFNEEGDDE